jgi:hypothetical protein
MYKEKNKILLSEHVLSKDTCARSHVIPRKEGRKFSTQLVVKITRANSEGRSNNNLNLVGITLNNKIRLQIYK